MFDTTIRGGAELRYVAGLLRKEAAAGLARRLRAGIRKATAPIRVEVPAEAAARMPSGYGPVLSRATKVAVRTALAGGPKVTVRIYAVGRKEQRDVRALDAGILRHPLFGNRRHWFAQKVRPGFIRVPIDRTRDRVVREALAAVDGTIDTIARG